MSTMTSGVSAMGHDLSGQAVLVVTVMDMIWVEPTPSTEMQAAADGRSYPDPALDDVVQTCALDDDCISVERFRAEYVVSMEASSCRDASMTEPIAGSSKVQPQEMTAAQCAAASQCVAPRSRANSRGLSVRFVP